MDLNIKAAVTAAPADTFFNNFRADVLRGLTQTPKKLQAKYFYDQEGDKLFQQIMALPEYYLTACEQEIFQYNTAGLANSIITDNEPFDLIELGAGDGTKTQYLLQYLIDMQVPFTYLPVDISGGILSELQNRLAVDIPGLRVTPLVGDYFEMLRKTAVRPSKRKVVMFLGANIGNMEPEEARAFCRQLRNQLQPQDRVLIGFDLKKHPKIIWNAYNDRLGITGQFNLNLLKRINQELGADFDLNQFEHYQTYDPASGACKSYLVSLEDQTISIAGRDVSFARDETIFMEISQKYSLSEITELAGQSGFAPVNLCLDSKGWFADACWAAV